MTAENFDIYDEEMMHRETTAVSGSVILAIVVFGDRNR